MAKRIDLTADEYLTQYDERATFHDADYFVANGDVGDIVKVSADVFDVSRISLARVGIVIGTASRSLATIAQSGNVNKHALLRDNGLSPFSLGDFGAYNHGARPNTYWSQKTYYVEKEFGLAGNVSNVFLHYGEKTPQKSDGISYHHREDFAGDMLLAVAAKFDGDAIGSETEYKVENFPVALNIAIPFDYNSSGAKPLTALYRTRSSSAGAWGDSNAIEDGGATINIVVWKVNWTVTNVTQDPAIVDLRGKDFVNVDIDFTFDILNQGTQVYNRTVYWAIYWDNDLTVKKAWGMILNVEIPSGGTWPDTLELTLVPINANSRITFSMNDYMGEDTAYSIGNYDILAEDIIPE